MRIDSGLVILLAIVAALVIVALALLFYSPGLLDLCAAIFATTFPTATDVFLHSVYTVFDPLPTPGYNKYQAFKTPFVLENFRLSKSNYKMVYYSGG